MPVQRHSCWNVHQKRQSLPHRQDDEEKGVSRGLRPDHSSENSADALPHHPGAYTVSKYAGDRKTEGLWPGNEGTNVCEFVLPKLNI